MLFFVSGKRADTFNQKVIYVFLNNCVEKKRLIRSTLGRHKLALFLKPSQYIYREAILRIIGQGYKK